MSEERDEAQRMSQGSQIFSTQASSLRPQASNKAVLVLEDGSVFPGESFGAPTAVMGEVVFNTSMTGYQEILTDPSYGGQIVTMTYPLIGNYGINAEDWESRQIQVRGFVVREASDIASNWRSRMSLHDLLAGRGVPGIQGVDTRALTRRLRSQGVMMGAIGPLDQMYALLDQIRQGPRYDSIDFVREVTAPARYEGLVVPGVGRASEPPRFHVAVIDYGCKYNIVRSLERLGCRTTIFPADVRAEEVRAIRPDGVVLSPGPGDPEVLDYAVDTVRELLGPRPVLGICLGHQLVARALGARTYKLKFGHRGGNHPVKDLASGRVHITSQNHGYAVSADDLPPGLEVAYLNLNDNTVEGLRHRDLPLISIQYHSEASPGPRDNLYLFEEFVKLLGAF